jgi:alkaline phosphatase
MANFVTPVVRLLSLLFFVFISSCATNVSSLSIASEVVLPGGQPPRNIILVMTGGMGLGQLTAGMYAAGNFTQLERCRVSGLHHGSGELAEPGLAAMAICTGAKSYPGGIGVNSDSVAVSSILEIARDRGKSTGIITTGSLFDPMPACFYAHVKKPAYYHLMPCQLAASGLMVGLGGGDRLWESGSSNCPQAFVERGVSLKKLAADGHWHDSLLSSGRQTLIFTGQHWPPTAAAGRTFLPAASESIVKYLGAEAVQGGYFLVIDAAQSGLAARNHDYQGLVEELSDLERTLKVVLDAAEESGNTLVVITAEQEAGGFSIQIGSRQDSIVPHFASRDATAIMVPVFAFGPWAEMFAGIYPATAIFEKLYSCIR